MLERVWRKGNPSTLLVRMSTGAGAMENSMKVSQKKTKSRAAILSSNPTPGYMSGENCNWKRYRYPYVHYLY